MSTKINGNGNLTVENNRITGDFSNATVANRVMFQTSAVNAQTQVGLLPNGTITSGAAATTVAVEDSNFGTGNSSVGSIGNVQSADIRITSGIRGTGTYLPMTFYTGGSERMRIDTSGNVTVSSAAGLGYGAGSGGTVTQLTSKSTAVTLNKPTGQITMNNAALGAGLTVVFTVNNSLVAATDTIVVNLKSGTYATAGTYRIQAEAVTTGAFQVFVVNQSAGSLSEAVVINFAIIKGATA